MKQAVPDLLSDSRVRDLLMKMCKYRVRQSENVLQYVHIWGAEDLFNEVAERLLRWDEETNLQTLIKRTRRIGRNLARAGEKRKKIAPAALVGFEMGQFSNSSYCYRNLHDEEELTPLVLLFRREYSRARRATHLIIERILRLTRKSEHLSFLGTYTNMMERVNLRPGDVIPEDYLRRGLI